ncbi:hypothetical protein F5B17DRAFT_34890 [Nemania serpens]|nr:hypothetical protein F5B17DRAFT_34890 [Nemania serpens]
MISVMVGVSAEKPPPGRVTNEDPPFEVNCSQQNASSSSGSPSPIPPTYLPILHDITWHDDGTQERLVIFFVQRSLRVMPKPRSWEPRMKKLSTFTPPPDSSRARSVWTRIDASRVRNTVALGTICECVCCVPHVCITVADVFHSTTPSTKREGERQIWRGLVIAVVFKFLSCDLISVISATDSEIILHAPLLVRIVPSISFHSSCCAYVVVVQLP